MAGCRHAPAGRADNREEILIIRVLLAALLFVPSFVAAIEPLAPVDGDFGARAWGGVFNPAMYEMRRDVDGENGLLSALSWKGGAASSSLTMGPQAGLELLWGILPDVRIVLSAEARGVSNKGAYKGSGAGSGGTASKDLFLSSYGGETGVIIMLREFDERSRISLDLRGGAHTLSGARESWSESGPLGKGSWTSSLSGVAPGALVGIDWEYSFVNRNDSFVPGAFLVAGYRFLSFTRVEYRYHDSTGMKKSGSVRDAAGERISIDMSGPEIRLGIQLAIPTKIRG